MVMVVLHFLFIILTIPNVLSEDLLKSQFPLYGLTEVAAKKSLRLKNVCNGQLKSIHNGIRKHETWALRMLDSSGTPANGFIWGNNYWLGTYSQCRWLSSKKPRLSLNSQEFLASPPFGVDFYISLFKQNTSLQAQLDAAPKDIIHLGLCLPSSCSLKDLEQLLTLWAKQKPLGVQNLYNFSLEFQKVRAVRPDFSWFHNPLTYILSPLRSKMFGAWHGRFLPRPPVHNRRCPLKPWPNLGDLKSLIDSMSMPTRIYDVIITICLLLTLSGTIYDIYVWNPLIKRTETENNCKVSNKTTEIFKTRNIQESSDLLNQDNNLNDCYELKIDNSQHKSMPVHIIKPMETINEKERGQNVFAKLSLCFSVTSNMKVISDALKVRDELSVIHGLRFFGMIWLIWLYSVFYLKHYADNRPLARRLSEGFSEHIISNSTFSVDTFFFTSGFSLAFKYYRNRRGSLKTERNFSVKRKVNEFSSMALRRFLRVTPVYIVVLTVVIISVKSIRQTSLFEIQEPADETCQKYWWRNFAYINNLYRGDEMCMSWSWYLSTDMQFFLLGVFILILSTRFWKFASFVAAALVILSSMLTGYLSYGNGYIPSSPQQLALLHVIHYSPWTRIGPYLIGMLTGYFVVHLKGELVFKKTILITCWLVWFFCNVWALFGLYNKNMSVLSTALHTALSRTAWGFGLSWIVIACCTKNAGAIKVVLSYPGWIPFSKLSYSAYLLSPLIITLITSNAETAMHFDFLQLIVYFFGHFGIIYFCAFFFAMILEIPVTTLGRRAFGQKQIQNQLNRQT